MRNNNQAVIRKISGKSLKNNRMRNIFAILAIILTGMLFTAVFSLCGGMIQVAQEQTMREVGGKFHAGLKRATEEQYERISADPSVKRSSYNIFLGYAENVMKRQAELRYIPDEKDLEDYFIILEEGRLPMEEDEVVVDTIVMDEFQLPHKVGEKIPLSFYFCGEFIEKEFTVSGWYEGDYVSHASELFLSEAFWQELRGERTDEDFLDWFETHPNDSGIGLRQINMFFSNTSKLEEKVCKVIENAGYMPGTELDYGVNWAYMQSRLESVDPLTYVFLGAAVLVILITGYLIIYNIFQISVVSDIRFYGLLKTIGTTKRQIRRLVNRQALMLSIIGIPIGILLGYAIGKWLLPFTMSFMQYQTDISLKFNPLIILLGAVFSIMTVFLSCRKPGKIAGSVSPVEAVKYTEGSGGVKNKRRKARNFSIFAMAIANLGRNKKKTSVVVAAISLSIILLTVVMTGVGSFRIEKFLEDRMIGDFVLGSVNITSGHRDGDFDIDEDYLAMADGQSGIIEKNEMYWYNYGMASIEMDDTTLGRYRKLDETGKLERNENTELRLEMVLDGEMPFSTHFYGYSTPLLKNLKVIEGTLDMEKFQSGDYILAGDITGCGEFTSEERVYRPGDKIEVSRRTESSELHEVKDEHGETLDVWYDNLETKEYEVMAVVSIPYSMNSHMYPVNGMDLVLPLKEFEGNPFVKRFAVSYQVETEAQESFENSLKSYTETPGTSMGYLSKNNIRSEFDGMVRVIGTIGIALAAVVAWIGILNFVNAVITGIIARKREFAMLQSIGMTNRQLQKMLIIEGICYVGIAGLFSLILGSLLAWRLLCVFNNIIMFFEYRFQILPFLIMIPILLFVAVIGPLAAYHRIQRKSIVERLREAE